RRGRSFQRAPNVSTSFATGKLMDASVSLTRRRSLHSDPKSDTRVRIHSSGTLSPPSCGRGRWITADTACWRRKDRLSAHGGRARGTDGAFRDRWEKRGGWWSGRDLQSPP